MGAATARVGDRVASLRANCVASDGVELLSPGLGVFETSPFSRERLIPPSDWAAEAALPGVTAATASGTSTDVPISGEETVRLCRVIATCAGPGETSSAGISPCAASTGEASVPPVVVGRREARAVRPTPLAERSIAGGPSGVPSGTSARRAIPGAFTARLSGSPPDRAAAVAAEGFPKVGGSIERPMSVRTAWG